MGNPPEMVVLMGESSVSSVSSMAMFAFLSPGLRSGEPGASSVGAPGDVGATRSTKETGISGCVHPSMCICM